MENSSDIIFNETHKSSRKVLKPPGMKFILLYIKNVFSLNLC